MLLVIFIACALLQGCEPVSSVWGRADWSQDVVTGTVILMVEVLIALLGLVWYFLSQRVTLPGQPCDSPASSMPLLESLDELDIPQPDDEPNEDGDPNDVEPDDNVEPDEDVGPVDDGSVVWSDDELAKEPCQGSNDGPRFFARCLRGGSSPCDLLSACVLCSCSFFALCSRGGSSPCALLFAGVLRGRLLPSPFPAAGVGGRFGVARRSVCRSACGLDHAFAWSVWCFRRAPLLRAELARRFLALPSVCRYVWPSSPLCLFLSAVGVSGLVEVCSPFGPLFSPT